ncbi:MAG TPA: pyruvate kinase alpha/beta domain-containing protein, partial [Candidatus Binatia bacterium]|nr:pyruvate kinase alpha/beta domain-containing protein [Candidatus Binatia bacterium]
PIVAVTPEPQTVRPLMLVWGVQPFLLEKFTSTDAMIKAAIYLAFQKGIVIPGNKVVIVAAAPYTLPGETDFLRVATLNDPP